jgi:hypothetical protein
MMKKVIFCIGFIFSFGLFIGHFYVVGSGIHGDTILPPSSFGMRYLDCNLIFAFGLTYFIERFFHKFNFKFIILIIFLFIIWNILLIFQFLLETFDINKPVNFWHIFINQFTIIFKVIKVIL